MFTELGHLAMSSTEFNFEDLLCEGVLRQVLSWLDIKDISNANLVCRRWAAAATCKEAWRRRVHPQVLDLCHRGCIDAYNGKSLTALLRAVYAKNFLVNAAFLERHNMKGWPWHTTSRSNPPTWEYPMLVDCLATPQQLPDLPIPDLMPYQTGCLACNNAWTELVQVVDLEHSLLQSGMSKDLAQRLLASGLPLGLSVWVTERPGVEGDVQVVAMCLTEERYSQVVGGPGGLPQENAALLSLMLVPPGCRFSQGAQARQAAGAGASQQQQQQVDGTMEVMRSQGCAVTVVGPTTAPAGTWRQLRVRVASHPDGQPARYVVLALRGRVNPVANASVIVPKFAGPKFALAHVGFWWQDQAAAHDRSTVWC